MKLLFDQPPTYTIPVDGENALYPVHRIFCVGRNFAAHATEMGAVVDREAPFYFTKSPSATVLSGATIPYPPGTENYHYEMELALCIGRPIFRGTRNEAKAAIFGYMCALDMTRRDLQLKAREKQRPWDLAKDGENSAVFAPITKAHAFEPQNQRIRLEVNGEMKQDATIDELIWKVDDIVTHLSQYYHLRPGDIIMTGTPAGVGPVKAGDKISGAIDGLAPIALNLGNPE